jgi:Fur family transcriptional regulator, ferric uptake regulator
MISHYHPGTGFRFMRRDTQQREAIRKAVLEAERPVAIQEILESAQRDVSHLGMATVYRNLKTLQEDGLIVPVNISGQPSRWESAIKSHHHHFLCLTCNKLFDIPDCPKGLARILPAGFDLEEHDILLRGKCNTCAGK